MAGRHASFREFYPFCLGEHSNRTCRRLHFVGTGLGLAQAVAAIALLTAYGCGWVGHFFFW
jgi:hypothetical protein